MSMLQSRLREVVGFPYAYDEIAFEALTCKRIEESAVRSVKTGQVTKRQSFDACDLVPEEIRGWLHSLPLRSENKVDVVWIGTSDGISIEYGCFVSFYDDLWFPSSDDLWICNSTRDMILLLDHEEHFTFYSHLD